MSISAGSTASVPWAALAPVFVILLAFVGFCLIDIARHPVKHLPKWVWAIICFVSIPIGAVVYLIVGRDSGRSS